MKVLPTSVHSRKARRPSARGPARASVRLALLILGVLILGAATASAAGPMPVAAASPANAEVPQLGAPLFTKVLLAAKDNTLFEDSTGMLSNGAGDYVFTGQTFQKGENLRRALLAFEVASSLPGDAVVSSVELRLVLDLTIASASLVAAHRLTSDWGEGASIAPMGEGIGGPAEPGDATWLDTFFGSSTWTTAGGDFEPTASATTTVGGAAETGPVFWASATLAADVQGWIDTPATDFGWVLLGDESASPPTAKRYASRNATNGAARPTLTVTYESPSTVFFDGFESGNVLAWSSSTGGP
ncbi:MAG: hypothetical protein MI919_39210 [Holophagales bacterium]|nr:hypothetical protein [Holophagales bacterium]